MGEKADEGEEEWRLSRQGVAVELGGCEDYGGEETESER